MPSKIRKDKTIIFSCQEKHDESISGTLNSAQELTYLTYWLKGIRISVFIKENTCFTAKWRWKGDERVADFTSYTHYDSIPNIDLENLQDFEAARKKIKVFLTFQ